MIPHRETNGATGLAVKAPARAGVSATTPMLTGPMLTGLMLAGLMLAGLFCSLLPGDAVAQRGGGGRPGGAPALPAAPNVGFGRMAPLARPGVPVVKPLLVIMLEFSDVRFKPQHTREFYRQLFFGPGYPTVADFYAENSGGLFRLRSGGVIGPLRMPDDPATPENESLADCGPWATNAAGRQTCPGSSRSEQKDRTTAVRLAAQAGINFAAFDTNRDGVVSDDELMVVVITAARTDNCGALRGYADWPFTVGSGANQREFQVYSAGGFAENADFATITHETSHSLGTLDLYGPWNNPYVTTNQSSTLMGGTCGGQDRRWSVNLEAFHRIQLGWTRPRVLPLSTPGQCLWLDSSNRGDAAPSGNRAPILLWDPARGADEFFLLEHRRRSRAEQPVGNNVAPSSRYDADVADSGLAVWYVRTGPEARAAFSPILVQRRQVAGAVLDSAVQPGSDDIAIDATMDGAPDFIGWGRDNVLQSRPAQRRVGIGRASHLQILDEMHTGATVWVASPLQNGTVWETGPMGVSAYFKRTHGSFRLIWPGGRDSGFRVQVGDDGTDPLAVRVDTPAGLGLVGEPACVNQSSPDGNGPPRFRLPACIARPSVVDEGNPTRRRFQQLRLGDPLLVRITFDTPLRSPATVSLRVLAGAAVTSARPTSRPAGSTGNDFLVYLTGADFDFVQLEASITRTFSDSRPPETRIIRASFSVTPDQPFFEGDARLTCEQRDRLAAQVRELRYLSLREHFERPIPGPEPFISLAINALSRLKTPFPSHLSSFLNRAPAGATKLQTAGGSVWFVPKAAASTLGHFARQHLDLKAYTVERRLSGSAKQIRSLAPAATFQLPAGQTPALIFKPSIPLKPHVTR